MAGRSRAGSESRREARLPLALRRIEGNLSFGTAGTWAWFWVPTERWAFRPDGERSNLVVDIASRVSTLTGRQLHLRVTSRPYPAASWARDLDARTPDPLRSSSGVSWADHLVRAQRHVRASTMADKEVYLGVRLLEPGGIGGGVGRLLGTSHGPARGRLEKDAALVAELVSGAGMQARPAQTRELEWLLHRSLGLGLPSPGTLSPVRDATWETEDLFEISDTVAFEAEPFGQTVKIIRRGNGRPPLVRHAAVVTMGRVESVEVPETAQDPWLVQTDRMPFGVEWSIRLDVLDGQQALDAVSRKLLVVRDMQRHYREHDLDEPLALERQARQAREMQDDMVSGGDVTGTRVHGWFRMAVTAADGEQCLERVRAVMDTYRKRRMTVVHPKGQFGLLREFVPGEPLSSTAYRRRLPVIYFAAGVPTASSRLGDRRGPYIGHTSTSSRRAVMFDTHFATEVRETSGLVPIVGSLGSGKSVLAGLITYEAVRRGIHAVVLDPSGPLANLTALPELAAVSRHLDLTTAAPGTLNPYAVVPEPRPGDHPTRDALEEARALATQDRKMLALDVATMLLPPALAALPRTRLLLTEAVRATRGAPGTSLWSVVELLERQTEDDARDIAAFLRDMAELPLARLFFPTGPAGDAVGVGDDVLTVLTMPGLILPPSGVNREHWSTSEQLAIPLLHLACWYATRAIYGRPRVERKLIALDETHFLADWGAGRSLFNRLGRDSRKWNTCVLAASQNPKDVLGMEVSNFISSAFVGRIEDDEVAADALRMLRIPPGVGYESVLARLSPRGAPGERSRIREFVMRDVDGNVDRMRVDLDHLPELLAALDTTARPDETDEWARVPRALAESSWASGPVRRPALAPPARTSSASAARSSSTSPTRSSSASASSSSASSAPSSSAPESKTRNTGGWTRPAAGSPRDQGLRRDQGTKLRDHDRVRDHGGVADAPDVADGRAGRTGRTTEADADAEADRAPAAIDLRDGAQAGGQKGDGGEPGADGQGVHVA
jgi:hypothetical protein